MVTHEAVMTESKGVGFVGSQGAVPDSNSSLRTSK